MNDTRKTGWSDNGDGLGPATAVGDAQYVRRASTQLVVAMTAGNLSCTCSTAAAGFADSGYILLEDELIAYSSKGTTDLNGATVATLLGFTRAQDGTVAASHPANSFIHYVELLYAKDHAVQSGCGFCGSLKWQDTKPVALPDDQFLPSDENRRRRKRGR